MRKTPAGRELRADAVPVGSSVAPLGAAASRSDVDRCTNSSGIRSPPWLWLWCRRLHSATASGTAASRLSWPQRRPALSRQAQGEIPQGVHQSHKRLSLLSRAGRQRGAHSASGRRAL
jgi:hypothetical protein